MLLALECFVRMTSKIIHVNSGTLDGKSLTLPVEGNSYHIIWSVNTNIVVQSPKIRC
jgi:hypothetical protein